MCLHAMLLRRTALDHVQLALHKKYRNKGCKNVFRKIKQRCRDVGMVVGMLMMVQCISHLCPHGKMSRQKNLRYKEGFHPMQQPMQVNILWLQDNLATL